MQERFTQLSRLLLEPEAEEASPKTGSKWDLLDLSREEFDEIAALAQSHHVIVRGFERWATWLRKTGEKARLRWVEDALEVERERIERAVRILSDVCAAIKERGLDVLVIKSLDHWPDLGSDLDLFMNAAPDDVLALMKQAFHAKVAPRSLGDRLANKWNFNVVGLPEPIEVHVGRLGQTGEQFVVSRYLLDSARTKCFLGREYRVPSTEYKIIISVLQRMYRHMNFRLCDIVDVSALADAHLIDYVHLKSIAEGAGIWEGVATYLKIVSDYAEKFHGYGLDVPAFVSEDARFGGNEIYYSRGFLRVPIMPHSAKLYGTQLAGTLRRGNLHAGARLSLFPWLATAALAKQKLTGDEKGIW